MGSAKAVLRRQGQHSLRSIFLGYRKGADGLPEIVPEEAEIIKRIYREFLAGKSTNAIAAALTNDGVPTPGKKTVWQRATVESILCNEKYKGSALLQKSFTVDFLTKKTKINEGEVPQYYVEDSHPAIIEPWAWGTGSERTGAAQKQPETASPRQARSPERSSAATAEMFLVPKPGTPPTATAVSSGNATANSKEITSAKRHI